MVQEQHLSKIDTVIYDDCNVFYTERNIMLEIFKNKQFAIRTLGTKDNPLFVAVDICKALGYKDVASALRKLDEDEKLVSKIYLSGQNRNVSTITESGLYTLIVRSDKSEAKPFRKWVTGEVLPSIRKTGKYELQQQQDSYLIDDPIKRAEAWIIEAKAKEKLQLENNLKSEKIKRDKPKVVFADAIECSINSCLIGTWIKAVELDKGIKLGQNKVFKWLRNNKYLIKSGRRKNNPMQKYIDNGYFELKVGKVATQFGTRETFTTLITGRGQIALVNKLLT